MVCFSHLLCKYPKELCIRCILCDLIFVISWILEELLIIKQLNFEGLELGI